MTPIPDHNPELSLPSPIGTPPRLAAPDVLAQAGAATDTQFELSGRRARLVVNPRLGVVSFYGDGRVGTGAWKWSDATGATVVRSPRMIRRELASRIGTVIETIVVPDGLPGMIVQIERLGGPADAPPLRLTVELLPSHLPPSDLVPAVPAELDGTTDDAAADSPRPAALQYSQSGGTAVLTDGDRRLSVCSSLPELVMDWQASDNTDATDATDTSTEGQTVVVDVPLPVGEVVTFLMMLDTEGDRAASIPALAALPAHQRRAQLDAEGDGHTGLRVVTGVTELDEGMAWIRARLRDRLLRPAGGGEDRLHPPITTPITDAGSLGGPGQANAAATPWLVRGALATGDWEVAKAALTVLPPSPGMLVAWSRWVGWTGQRGPFLAHRPAIETALQGLKQAPPFTAERIRKAVADAAEAAGEEVWAEALRALPQESGPAVSAASTAAPASPASPTSPASPESPTATPESRRLTLPVLGSPPPSALPAGAADQSHGTDGGPANPPQAGTGSSATSTPAGTGSSSATPDAADLALAAELALPLPSGSSPMMSDPVALRAADDFGAAAIDSLRAWSLGGGDSAYAGFRQALGRWGESAPGDESSAGAIAASLVEGMLGARPDAAFERLRLAPCFPSSWTGLQIDGITVEKMRLGMTYRREGDRHSFVFTPEAGSIPGMLIFEPRLSGKSLREVRIDGQVAEVGSERVGDRVQIQVQLPADAERRIEIDLEPISSSSSSSSAPARP